MLSLYESDTDSKALKCLKVKENVLILSLLQCFSFKKNNSLGGFKDKNTSSQ